MTGVLDRALRRWLLALNAVLAAFLAGSFAAPVLAALGASQAAAALYTVYHLACHQWAFRSFFLFGPSVVYSEDQLGQLNLDPFTFVGSPDLGYKIAICERDVAIYAGLLAVGLLYARGRFRWRLSLGAYCVLILPMAIDGFTQLFGWRESSWQLRVLTGLLFGVASAWLLLPRLEDALFPAPAPNTQSMRAEQYPPAQDATAAWPTPAPLPVPPSNATGTPIPASVDRSG